MGEFCLLFYFLYVCGTREWRFIKVSGVVRTVPIPWELSIMMVDGKEGFLYGVHIYIYISYICTCISSGDYITSNQRVFRDVK